jgi:hypothetical protein
MPATRKSTEDEDDNNNKEDDCATATAAATAATPTTTAGRHASSATTATASDQAVAAVAAAQRSGLRLGAVAAVADSRIPSLTPVFLCHLSEYVLHVAQNTMFHGSFPPDSSRIPGSGGF